MRLEIFPLRDFEYRRSLRAIPFVALLTCAVETEIVDRLQPMTVSLRANYGDKEEVFSISVLVTGTFQHLTLVSEESPKFELFDALEFDREVEVPPGSYDLSFKARVFVVKGEGFRDVELTAQTSLDVV